MPNQGKGKATDDPFVYVCPYCQGLARADSYYRDYTCEECGKRFAEKPERYRMTPIGDYVNAIRYLAGSAHVSFTVAVSSDGSRSRAQAEATVRKLKDLSPRVVADVAPKQESGVGVFDSETYHWLEVRIKDGRCRGKIRVYYDPA